MKKPVFAFAAILILSLVCVFFFSCEKNYITQAPVDHIPEYHMTFCYVTEGILEPRYILTINTKTHEIIDSIELQGEPYRDVAYIDGGNKAVITNFVDIFVEDVLTHDTLAIADDIGVDFEVSSDEQYIVSRWSKYILSLPGLAIIDSTENLRHIGIDGINEILYAYHYPTNQIYSIDFSVTPNETTMADFTDFSGGPIELYYYGYLSPDNETLLLSYICQGGYGLVEYDADSLYVRNEIACLGLRDPVWTSDGSICYGINYDYNVVKYNITTKIYTIIIDKNDIYSSNYWSYTGERFSPDYLQITPDDKYIYIQTTPEVYANGYTLVYDLSAKEFIYRYEYSKSQEGWNLISLNPKDWSK